MKTKYIALPLTLIILSTLLAFAGDKVWYVKTGYTKLSGPISSYSQCLKERTYYKNKGYEDAWCDNE